MWERPRLCSRAARQLTVADVTLEFVPRSRHLTRRFILLDMRKTTLPEMALSSAFLLLCLPALPAQTPPAADPKSVPVIDGGIGPCSADFTVTGNSGSPVYDAKIRVHIAYGFLNAHKLDLEVGTNAAGKASFTGLPNKTKQGLFFQASKGDQEASAFDDPAKTCKADFTVMLEKKSQ